MTASENRRDPVQNESVVKLTTAQIATWVAFLSLPSLIWAWLDQRVWPWDQSHYAENSTDLYRVLLTQPSQWLEALLGAVGFKAPLIAWIGEFFVPLGLWLQHPEFGLLIISSLATITAWFLTALAVTYLASPKHTVVLSSVTFFAAAPLVLGIANHYFVEPLVMAVVSGFWFVAARAHRMRIQVVLLSCLALIATALAAKLLSPIFLIGPSFLLVQQFWLRRSEFSSWGVRDVLALGLISAPILLVINWYIRNYNAVWKHARNAASGDVALDYGWIASFGEKLLTWLNLLMQSTVPWPFLLALLVSVAGVGLLIRRASSLDTPTTLASKTYPQKWLLASACIAQLLLVLCAFSLNITVEPRYLTPLMPSLTILASLIIAALPAATRFLLGLTVLAQFAYVQAISFGLAERPAWVSWWVTVLERDTHRKDVLRSIVATTCGVEDAGSYTVIGVEYPHMNANTASYYASLLAIKTGNRCRYTSLGYAAKDPQAGFARVREAKYFATVAAFDASPPNFLNKISEDVFNLVTRAPEFVAISSPYPQDVVIYKRR